MQYTIISIDETRAANKADIRSKLTFDEVFPEFVNGKDREQLLRARNKWNIPLPSGFSVGEYGIFYSLLNTLEFGQDNGILYFEDDALVQPDFQQRFECYLADFPDDLDFFVIWNASNQTYDYHNVKEYNDKGEPIYHHRPLNSSAFDFGHSHLCKAYNGYGNVAMYFSPRGCKNTIEYIRRRGMFSTPDCLLYIGAHDGSLNAYSLKPDVPKLVEHDWNAQSTRAGTEWIILSEI